MIPSRPLSFSPWRLCALLAAAVLAGCASEPTPPTPTVEEAAAAIIKAMQRKRDTVYVLGRWRWVMLVVRYLPEFIFKRTKL